MSKQDIQECIEAWKDVLNKYGAARPLIPGEDIRIGRLVQQYGKEIVLLAFLGAKYEPASEGYKPSRFLSLNRICDPTKFERFVNLGAQAKNQLQQKQRSVEIVSKEEECNGAPAPAEVLSFIKNLGRSS